MKNSALLGFNNDYFPGLTFWNTCSKQCVEFKKHNKITFESKTPYVCFFFPPFYTKPSSVSFLLHVQDTGLGVVTGKLMVWLMRHGKKITEQEICKATFKNRKVQVRFGVDDFISQCQQGDILQVVSVGSLAIHNIRGKVIYGEPHECELFTEDDENNSCILF